MDNETTNEVVNLNRDDDEDTTSVKAEPVPEGQADLSDDFS